MKATPGAMRAAERINKECWPYDMPTCTRGLIEIIETETHCGEMLEALEEINGICEDPKLPYGKEVVRIAREAIKKAKGE